MGVWHVGPLRTVSCLLYKSKMKFLLKNQTSRAPETPIRTCLRRAHVRQGQALAGPGAKRPHCLPLNEQDAGCPPIARRWVLGGPCFPSVAPREAAPHGWLPRTGGCRGHPRLPASSFVCSWEMGRRSREKKPGAGVLLLGHRGERSPLSKARLRHCGLSLSAPRPRSGNSFPSCSYQPEAQPSLSTAVSAYREHLASPQAPGTARMRARPR